MKTSEEEYKKNVNCAENLLLGRDEVARKMLITEMHSLSKSLDFENAAKIRDRLKAISVVQSRQYSQISELTPIDFIAVAKGIDKSVVVVSFFRSGKNTGSEKFIIQNSSESDDFSDILRSFILQFYANVNVPDIIVISHHINDCSSLQEFCGQFVRIVSNKNETYDKIIESCLTNAQLQLKKESTNMYEKHITKLCELLKLNKICRIEAYDNSHIQGTNACGVMIVFESGKIQNGKNRKFNINNEVANGGNDAGMMSYILKKRFKSKIIDCSEIPDIVLIDGGISQVSAACAVVESFNLKENVKVIGIAKRSDRKVGYEKIILENGNELYLSQNDDLLNFLIMLRNEAHKTAINFHRRKRNKSLVKSILNEIPMIGDVRRKKLLEHFGSIDFIKKASIEDLKMVKGIDDHTATLVFSFFNVRSDG
jgi:excinuclease ABC subunit C